MLTIDDLEVFFDSYDLDIMIQLNESTLINNLKECVESNILYLRSNPGRKGYMPYYLQLLEIKDYLTKP